MIGAGAGNPALAVPGRLIVLTGPPGAGKTTVASLLAGRLYPSVHLHSDDFWHYLRQGRLEPYLPEAHRQNQTVIDALAQAAVSYAAGGYQVVCDGIVGPWFLGVFRAAAAAREVPLHYVILRPDEATVLRRAAGRGGRELTDPAPVRSLHRQFRDLGELEAHVVDSTSLTPEQTVAAVLRRLAEGAALLVP